MKVVVTGFGSTGDIQPLIALAAGLHRAGHSVVLVTDEGAEATASELGLVFRVLAGSARSVVVDGTHGWAETIASGRPSPRLFLEVGRFNTRSWIETIAAAAEDADAIVATTMAVYHAGSVARDRGIPLIFGQLQPTLETRDYPPPLSGLTGTPAWLNRPLSNAMSALGDLSYRSGINRVRREDGLPRLRLVWEETPILMAWSPTLLPAASDWKHPDLTITGSWRLPTAPGWEPPAELAQFLDAGEPPVFVGFGSVAGFPGTEALQDAVLEGLSGRRVLLASGWAGFGEGDLPEGVLAIGPTPYDWLFPRCAALFHHCGAGTTDQAARSGAGSVPVPFTGDQPFWAGRLHRLGVASAPLNPRKPSPDAVRAALSVATSDPLRRRAAEVARRMAVEPDGVATAIDAIERIAAG